MRQFLLFVLLSGSVVAGPVVMVAGVEAGEEVATAQVADAAVRQLQDARASVQLEELVALRDLQASGMVWRARELDIQIEGSGLSPVEKALAQERLQEVRRLLPLRAAGEILTPEEVADLRVRHEWAAEALQQGRATQLDEPFRGPVGEGLYALAKRVAGQDRVNPGLYRIVTDALRAAGLDLPTPVRRGTGWLGTGVRGEPLY